MKDSLRLYKDFKVLETLCTCCQEIDHDIENCPLLTLQLNRQKIIRRHLFSRSQERGILHRKYRKKMNALFRFKEIENKALKIEIPANFSSSCEGKSDNNSDDNTSRNISFIPRSDSNIKPKPLDSPTKDGSLKCYETFDELNMKTNSSKRPSFLGDSKSRIEKKEDSYKASNLDFSMDPLNPKFCSLELLIEEKNNKRQVNRSEMEINPLFNQKNNISNSAEEEREDNGTILTGNSGNSQQNIQKKNNFEKSKSNEDIKKRNSASYGSFSTNSLQNLKLFKEDHFFQTDEILGGTNKANTTTMATIQEFLLKNFEIKNSFKVYFPHNNYENVIKWCRILQKGKRKIVNKQ